MDLSTFIVAVFYEVDNWFMGQQKLWGRAPEPELSDPEVLTMEIVVVEFLSIDSEKDLFAYFKHHYAEWFPALAEVHLPMEIAAIRLCPPRTGLALRHGLRASNSKHYPSYILVEPCPELAWHRQTA